MKNTTCLTVLFLLNVLGLDSPWQKSSVAQTEGGDAAAADRGWTSAMGC